jgi:hypothetical protein
VAADVSPDFDQPDPKSDPKSDPRTDRQADPLAWSGPWADDARRLFELLKGAAAQAGAGPAGNQGDSAGEAGPEHSPDCRYCPLCQGMAALRRSGPDVLDRLAEVAAGLAATLRATEAGPRAAQQPRSEAEPDSRTDSTSAAPRPPSTVRIDITD